MILLLLSITTEFIEKFRSPSIFFNHKQFPRLSNLAKNLVPLLKYDAVMGGKLSKEIESSNTPKVYTFP